MINIFKHRAAIMAFIACALTYAALATLVALKLNFIGGIAIAIFGFFYTFLSAYDVHCTLDGFCNMWSWLKVIIIMLNGGVLILTILYI